MSFVRVFSAQINLLSGKIVSVEVDTARGLNNFTIVLPESEKILNDSATKFGLSARAYHRTQKLARIIADLGESEHILPEHILEAIRYRPNFE